ncbi:unnamed protein product [Prorocentrum cordatum]|uniref:Meiosis-specific nuclear structural protein 1 n=1 Tax=Prorocentrum cordatum TaxID=2364126 RepID=A0ABN9VZ97_9DINO|nr:unnamed protein product [Polarella glacialis]
MARETREIKSLQSKLKWNMVREDQRLLREEERRRDRADLADEAVFQRAVQQGIEEEWQERVTEWIEDSRDFQEHKRVAKQQEAIEEAARISEEYLTQKENSEFAARVAQAKAAERNTWGVAEHIEQYQAAREAEEREKRREVACARQRRAEERLAGMDAEMQRAARARDEALRELEAVRAGAQRRCAPAPLLRARGGAR